MRWIALLITLFQFGCTGIPGGTGRSLVEVDTAALLTSNAEAGTNTTTARHAPALLAVSPEMRAFVDTIEPALSPNRRFHLILRALRQDGFLLDYDLHTTTTAAEAFALRQGNCISFSALIVALAREVGLQAHFNLVEAPLGRSRVSGGNGGTLVKNVLHINAEVTYGWYKQIIELNFEPPTRYAHKQLSDTRVQALYLNNRALELSQVQSLEKALTLTQEALSIEPKLSLLWNTLGYIYRLNGDLELAEMSYTQALNLEANNTAAKKNLRNVYELLSRQALSQDANDRGAQGQGS
ncbi:tetratricopeptide repeat protein [Microbulbifer bruguierae]|uniref:Tetratricopeptide repeat protein n=1 Tax=Microbulbifer bruguierae TaxID=3029061 RepID=A0ABY8NAD0_9GAMM|nr:tetratricopeptide repeat protein [Microbulbifer bruguierae]WGL15866.1 tetratricopeptide repeat protein [Microbulbifer bruguierae]